VVSERLNEAIWHGSAHSRSVETLLRNGATPYDVASSVMATLSAKLIDTDPRDTDQDPLAVRP
jgi:hypothetical protein